MEIKRDIFLGAERGKQMEYIWDSLEEIKSLFKIDKKRRYTITAVSGFFGGSFTMLIFQAKMLWKSIIGG